MVVRGEYGVLTIKPDGSYIYRLNNTDSKVQGLTANDTKEEVFTIIATDTHGAKAAIDLKVTVTGQDDNPEVTVDKILSIQEGSKDIVSGTITVFDADKDDKPELSFGYNSEGKPITSVTNEYGTFELKDNAYSFVLNNNSDKVKAIKAGQLVESSVTLLVKDNQDHTVTQEIMVNIKGTASLPEVTAVIGDKDPSLPVNDTNRGYDITAVSGAGEEYRYTATGQILAKDYEADKAPDFTVKTQGTYGTLTICADGTYTYIADAPKVKALYEGEKVRDEVTILLKAENGLTVTKSVFIDIMGVNDAPVAAAAAVVGLIHDNKSDGGWTTGEHAICATDADTGDKLHYTLTEAISGENTVNGTFGTLTFSQDDSGHLYYEYKLDMGHDSLITLAETHADGKPLVDVFGYTVHDNYGGSATGHIDVNVALTTGFGDEHDTQAQLLFGDADRNTLSGGAGDDILSGWIGDDTLHGGGGHDYLFGGAGNDYLYGEDGNDHLYGGAGDDHLYGGLGNDHLYGGDGDDFLDGGDGDDFLDGGANTYNPATGEGGNILCGGEGNDVLVFHQGDSIDGGTGTDVLVIRSGSVDDLFKTDDHGKSDMGNISNMEILVSSSGTMLNNLTSVSEIAKAVGIAFNNNGTVDTTPLGEPTATYNDGTHDWNVYTTQVSVNDTEETVKVAVLQTSHAQG